MILADAVRSGDEVVCVELARRGTALHFAASVFALVIAAPLLTLFLAKHCFTECARASAWRAALLVHDAVISNARCYSEREMLHLAERAMLTVTVTVLFGRPRQKTL